MREPPEFVFVLDTDAYAGSFERDMCAFITGRVGECKVGKEWAQVAQSELSPADFEWIDSALAQVPDDHGTRRPVSIYRSPAPCSASDRWNSVAIYFQVKPTKKITKLILRRAKEFCKRTPRSSYGIHPGKILGYRLLCPKLVVEVLEQVTFPEA